MKTLISMTDFVLDCVTNETFVSKVVNYAQFLKQPLKLEMFVPCDENGNVLEEYKFFYKKEALHILSGDDLGIALKINEKANAYRKAKEKVLFEGFEYVKFINDGELLPYHRLIKNDEYFNVRFLDRNIEDLLTEFEYGIELTPTALKQIGLCTNMEVG